MRKINMRQVYSEFAKIQLRRLNSILVQQKSRKLELVSYLLNNITSLVFTLPCNTTVFPSLPTVILNPNAKTAEEFHNICIPAALIKIFLLQRAPIEIIGQSFK